jgi:hypothetical protein
MTLTPATVRLDLKCGNGSISPGEKCTKGTATKRAPRAGAKERFLKKAGTLGAIGSLGYTAGALLTGRSRHVVGGLSAFNASAAALNAGEALGYERKGQKAKAAKAKMNAVIAAGHAALGAGILAGDVIARRKSAQNVHRAGQYAYGAGQRPPGAGGAGYRGAQGGQYAYGAGYRGTGYRGAGYRGAGYRGAQGGAGYSGAGYRGAGYRGAGYRGAQGGAGRPRRGYQGDPFQELGVSASASANDLKKAWKAKLWQHHPDRGGDQETAKKINEAYQAIMRSKGIKDSIYVDGFDIDWEAIAL